MKSVRGLQQIHQFFRVSWADPGFKFGVIFTCCVALGMALVYNLTSRELVFLAVAVPLGLAIFYGLILLLGWVGFGVADALDDFMSRHLQPWGSMRWTVSWIAWVAVLVAVGYALSQ